MLLLMLDNVLKEHVHRIRNYFLVMKHLLRVVLVDSYAKYFSRL